MTTKKTTIRTTELKQLMKQADLAENQITEQALLKEAEEVETSGEDPKRYLVNQLIGRIQMANGFAKLATVAVAADMEQIKDNKLYQGVTIALEDGKVATIATWEQFCVMAIGISRRTGDDLVANIKSFGPEAFNAMQRAGIGPSRFNRLRANLSGSEKDLMIRDIELHSGDAETIKVIVENAIADQAAKHANEKEAAEKRIADQAAELEAVEQRLQKKEGDINELHKKLNLAKKRSKTWNGRAFDIAMETTEKAFRASQAFDQLDVLRDAILTEDFGEDVRDQAIAAMANVYYDACRQLFVQASKLMDACEEVFEGYRDSAIPLIEMTDIFGPEAIEQAMAQVKD